MTEMTGAKASKGAVPIVFRACNAWCFGWFHAALPPALGVGVVLCRPMGYEAICAYRTYTRLAENLANAGFDVIRFDYHGTGDSAGSDTDPDRVRAWIDSSTSAANELRRLGGVSRLAFFGVRLGATLAAQAASQLGGVESLVLWAPCVTGAAFVRELRAASSNRSKPEPAQGGALPGDIEALGHSYTAQTLRDLDTLDCRRLDTPPARRVMVIGRDDMPVEGPLPTRYKELGMDTTYTVLPGYAGMMVEPHEGVLEHTTLGVITEWLSAAPVPQAALLDAPGAEAPHPVDPVVDGIRETSILFGSEQSLFGILAEPAEFPASDRRSETAILMLNVGGNYHVGPNRIYVRMARSWAASGYRAFRFDLAGIGDSRSGAGLSPSRMYSKESTADVRSAIDCLVAKGCKTFIVMGICSGAFLAFQTAMVDPRVTGQILMNPRLLEPQDENGGSAWQGAMQMHYKSTHFYRRALLHPEVYRRILRGEVDINGIAGRFRIVIQTRLKRAFDWLLQRAASQEDVLTMVRGLGARGTDTLLIMAAEDDGRDYIDFHFGTQGSRMLGYSNFRILLVEESDHTFSNSRSQKFVIANVQAHLEKRASIKGQAGVSSGATFS